MEAAKTAYTRLKNLCSELKEDGKENKEYLAEFEKEINNDLNTAGALNVLWKLIREDNTGGKIETIKKMDEILGLELLKKAETKTPKEILKIVKEREIAREKKDWKKSDSLRKVIQKKGYDVLDSAEGSKVIKKI